MEAGTRIELTPVPKTMFREFETHQHHPRVTSQRVSVTNYQDFQYYGNVLFGSNQQAMKVIFDPGSTTCWLPTTDCPTDQCTGSRFNWETTSTFSNTSVAGQEAYVAGTISGFFTEDHVCVSQGSCSDKSFKFLSAKSASGQLNLIKADGVCGLAPQMVTSDTNLVHKIRENNGI